MSAADVRRFMTDFDLTVVNMEPLHEHVLLEVGRSILPGELPDLTPEMRSRVDSSCYHVHRSISYQQMMGITGASEPLRLERLPDIALSGLELDYVLGLADEYFAWAATQPHLLARYTEVDQETVALITKIKATGAHCSVVTGSARVPVTSVLGGLGLSPLLDLQASVFADDVTPQEGKPGGKPYLLGMERGGPGPTACLEDNLNGSLSAVRAGVRRTILRPSGPFEHTVTALSEAMKREEAAGTLPSGIIVDVVRRFGQVQLVS